jgi:inosine-uridine nucleoside N-ribohydrolase
VIKPAPKAPTLVTRIHVDTDPGLDDLLALALALASPELKLEGITTVAGNASIEAVTENVCRFLALVGIEIPTGRGAAAPLSLTRVDAEHIHGSDGRKGITMPEPGQRRLPTAHAVLRQSLRECRVERIVALGPLTNLAHLLDEEPGLFEQVEIVWMGGSLSQGNVTPVAEFNAHADPGAAARVLSSGLRVRVIGLDVTNHVRVHARELPDAPFGMSPTARFLEQVLRGLMETEHPVQGEPCALLHDPCAVAAALVPSWFRYEDKVLDVHVQEGRERGRLAERQAGAGPPVRYAVEVQSFELVRLILDRLAAWSGKVSGN